MARKQEPSSVNDPWAQAEEAVACVLKRVKTKPSVGIILGTGLGTLAQKIEREAEIPYAEIPYFPRSTAPTHAGKLVFGTLSGKPVVAMEGRFHYYEGYSLAEVTFPVRVMRRLGAAILVVTNAAGGLNLDYPKGHIVLIEDHINGMGVNPLVGPNEERFGPRFPDMAEPYSRRLILAAGDSARAIGVDVGRGVYFAVTGPCLETRAEYRMMRRLGADLVGMSTVPEVIVGVHMGMEILGMSIVTDVCDPDHLAPVDIREIIKTANEAGPKLDRLVEHAVGNF